MADEHWLDTLGRALAVGTSRRESLRLAGAVLVGVLLPGGAVQAVGKRPKQCTPPCPTGQTCKRGRCVSVGGKGGPCKRCGGPASPSCCGGICVNLQTDSDNCSQCGELCAVGEVCQQGQCRCEPGRERCGFGCVDTSKDAQHCGACFRSCPPGEVCTNRKCTCLPDFPFSPARYRRCGGVCVDINSDDHHCGACGRACDTPAAFCSAGRCRCATNYSDCGGVCANIENDPEHCGNCFKPCDPGFICCKGKCVDGRTDNNNCGTCGNTCGGDSTCQEGQCRCPESQATCPGCSQDVPDICCPLDRPNCCNCFGLQACCKLDQRCVSPAKCEDCQPGETGCGGQCCRSDQTCENGQCVSCTNRPTGQRPPRRSDRAPGDPCSMCCTQGRTCCVNAAGAEQCVELLHDFSNCGVCGRVCSPQTACFDGQCTVRRTCPGGCPSGLTCCPHGPGAVCVDPLRDSSNCGACGNGCGNAHCVDGRCMCPRPDGTYREPNCHQYHGSLPFCCDQPDSFCCGNEIPACCRPGGTCCPPRTDEDGKLVFYCCPPGQAQCCPSGLNCCGADEVCCPPGPGRIAGCCPADSVCTDEGCRALQS